MDLTLYTHAGCHLCERLEALLKPHLAALRKRSRVELNFRDIAADENWQQLYGERIPVLVADGRVILEGRPEASEVAAALAALVAKD